MIKNKKILIASLILTLLISLPFLKTLSQEIENYPPIPAENNVKEESTEKKIKNNLEFRKELKTKIKKFEKEVQAEVKELKNELKDLRKEFLSPKRMNLCVVSKNKELVQEIRQKRLEILKNYRNELNTAQTDEERNKIKENYLNQLKELNKNFSQEVRKIRSECKIQIRNQQLNNTSTNSY